MVYRETVWATSELHKSVSICLLKVKMSIHIIIKVLAVVIPRCEKRGSIYFLLLLFQCLETPLNEHSFTLGDPY